jgi:hypothetical protein
MNNAFYEVSSLFTTGREPRFSSYSFGVLTSCFVAAFELVRILLPVRD